MRESVDIEELIDDFVTFYIAGQETTASMLTFALVLTLLHPHVLERCVFIPCAIIMIDVLITSINYRLQSEVDEILSDKKYVSLEDLEKLEYTEQVQ